MATGIVGQHQITTFVTPVNGTSPIDANQCRGNDNTIKTLYDAHDVDATIHFQSSDLASRPAASIAGQKWMTSDAYRIYYDDGAAWHEAAYLPSAGGTVAGNVVITGTLRVNGAATFDTNVTVSSGTLAAQAVTATTGVFSGVVSLASATDNFIHQDSAWTWTSTGLSGGTVRGSIYIDSSSAAHITVPTTIDKSATGTLLTLAVSGSAKMQFTDAAAFFQGIGTTASAANAFIDNANSNSLLRSTSSLRYKDLRGLLPLGDARNIVLNARAIRYTPKEGGREHIGLAAEWMHALDPRVTTLDKEGRPDWVQYPHLTAPLMLVAQDHDSRIAALEARISH